MSKAQRIYREFRKYQCRRRALRHRVADEAGVVMKPSELKQRVFDDLFNGLALIAMLGRADILEVATGIRTTQADGDEKQLFLAVAYAIEAYANAEDQA